MATTRSAPTSLGGAGEGMSNQRQKAPIPNAITMPNAIWSMAHPTVWRDASRAVPTPPSDPPQFLRCVASRWGARRSTSS